MVKFWGVVLRTLGLFMFPCITPVDATQEITRTAKVTIFTMTIISQGSSFSFHMFRRSISRPVYPLRSLSTAAPSQARVSFPIDRIPLLEELFEVPVLRTSEMRAESLAEVK